MNHTREPNIETNGSVIDKNYRYVLNFRLIKECPRENENLGSCKT